MSAQEKPLFHLTIHEAQKLIQTRALSPVELTRAMLKRIEAVNGRLHAYLNLMADSALAEARVADAEILQGRYKGPLHGIPVAVKDRLDVEGAPAAIRKNNLRASEDSTAVHKLREAGAIMLGKLAMSSLPSDPPQARNPWNTGHITGGSSTGPGAAVAAGLRMGALGEDTAGSIRNPASLCGIVGLKPTYGRISRYGLAPLSWSLDHCGPMTWVVEDTAHKSEVPAIIKSGATSLRARLYLGIPTSAADYIQAQRIRGRVKRECAEVFRKVDLLALPCQLGPAPTVKEVGPLDTLYKHLAPEFHAPFNLAGLPAISIPCGFSRAHLPVALQLVGKPFDELTVLRAAHTHQQHARWHERRPPI